MFFSTLPDPLYLFKWFEKNIQSFRFYAFAIIQLLPDTAPGSLIGQEPRTSSDERVSF